jgi:hypothetical protein
MVDELQPHDCLTGQGNLLRSTPAWLVAKIEPGKFQFVGGKRFAIVGTEKDNSTTVFLVHLK